ncbi:MAG: HEAT repeat domain-containing protein [Elusimicrobia bacterium]|nr:HEAT repeat domain-containing protein [Elusimicrobiota bacterium]
MTTSFSRLICKSFYVSCLLPMALSPVWAVNGTFSDTDKQRIDESIAVLERQNADGMPQLESGALANLIAGKSMANTFDILLKSSSTDSGLTIAQRDYYRNHPTEFRVFLIQKELGVARIARIRKVFEDRLATKNHKVSKQAIWWMLANIGDERAKTRVKQLLNSKDVDIRFEAAEQLTWVQDSSGAKTLEEALASTNTLQVLKADTALARLGNPKGGQVLLKIVRSTSAAEFNITDKVIAINGLGYVKRPDVTNELIKILYNENPQIVGAAIESLATREFVRTPAIIERLFEIMEDAKILSLHRIDALQFCLLRKELPSGLRERLLKYASSDDPVLRQSMLRGFWEVGTTKDIKLITGYLEDSDRKVRENAEVAIRRITGVVLGDSARDDLDSVIAQRKAWWEQHKDDQEYR